MYAVWYDHDEIIESCFRVSILTLWNLWVCLYFSLKHIYSSISLEFRSVYRQVLMRVLPTTDWGIFLAMTSPQCAYTLTVKCILCPIVWKMKSLACRWMKPNASLYEEDIKLFNCMNEILEIHKNIIMKVKWVCQSGIVGLQRLKFTFFYSNNHFPVIHSFPWKHWKWENFSLFLLLLLFE